MQVYILQNVHSWAHRNPLTDTFPPIVGMTYPIPIYINTTDMYSSNLNTNIICFVLDIFCQQLGKIYVGWRVSVNPLGAGLGNVHFEIKFCTGYKLPTFWEYNSVEIVHQRVSVRPLGAGFRNIHFLFLYSYWI